MKIYPFTIPKPPHQNITIQIDKVPEFYDRYHQHEEIQLSLIVSGSGQLLIGNNVSTFSKGDLIGIGSNLPHLFKSDGKDKQSHMITIFFLKNGFGTSFFNLEEMEVVENSFNYIENGFKCANPSKEIKAIFTSFTTNSKFLNVLGLLQLLNSIAEFQSESIQLFGGLSKIPKNQGERLQTVMNYVLEYYANPIKLEEVSNKVHMSKNAFCRFFKQRTNKTFFEFLSEVRIHHAKQKLITQLDKSVNQIALDCGFNSISNFNKQFKEITGKNPIYYRKSASNYLN
ncbi:AraC family transcriptional regulator [Croceivirga lutea]|uniref:AraC family transcriptional regulator n=1 Tax=Croceivirga lutea TaxID=1775167 RepID=UPI0016396553|nr:AraC family transcriptional regulator [Croceivirga lutea]GGG43633.1 AraC family transcriptional regulator [Croceivirga lutea]